MYGDMWMPPRRLTQAEWDALELIKHDERRDAEVAKVAARKAAKAKADIGYQTPDFLVKGYYECDR